MLCVCRLNQKKYVNVQCFKCGALFDKEEKEHRRRVKLAKGDIHFYCDRACAGFVKESKPDAPFKLILRGCIKSANIKKMKCNLTKEFLISLWESQKGKCSYTGITLHLPTYKHEKSPRKASLDRIDSSKGYEQGNVEYVCVFVNLGKNGYSRESIKSILKESKEFNKDE